LRPGGYVEVQVCFEEGHGLVELFQAEVFVGDFEPEEPGRRALRTELRLHVFEDPTQELVGLDASAGLLVHVRQFDRAGLERRVVERHRGAFGAFDEPLHLPDRLVLPPAVPHRDRMIRLGPDRREVRGAEVRSRRLAQGPEVLEGLIGPPLAEKQGAADDLGHDRLGIVRPENARPIGDDRVEDIRRLVVTPKAIEGRPEQVECLEGRRIVQPPRRAVEFDRTPQMVEGLVEPPDRQVGIADGLEGLGLDEGESRELALDAARGELRRGSVEQLADGRVGAYDVAGAALPARLRLAELGGLP